MKGKRTKKIHKKGLIMSGVEEVEQLVCEDQAFRLAFCSINATPWPLSANEHTKQKPIIISELIKE